MFNRIKRGYAPLTESNTPLYSECQTSQLEPNLHDILVAYQHGEDVSDYIRMPAAKATAEQQFTNRIGKVDPLTELHDYVKTVTAQANAAVASDKAKSKKKSDTSVISETDPSKSE